MRTIEPICGIVHRLPPSLRLSIPRPKRTLLSSTRRWAEPLLAAHQELIQFLYKQIGTATCSSIYKQYFSFFRHSNLKIDDGTTITLYSAALILNWIAGRAIKTLPYNASLSDAESWFHGEESFAPLLSSKLNEGDQDAILAPLRDLHYGHEFLDILPYACEVFETSDEILKAFGASRKSKRATGIFYTPSDIADYIIEHTISLHSRGRSAVNELTWLDPACGTACLLLSALFKVSEIAGFESSEDALNYTTGHLFGMDISPLALQSAVYNLVITCVQSGLPEGMSLRQCLLRIGQNLSLNDATDINTHEDLSRVFPVLKQGADCVASNPPYAKRSINLYAAQPRLFIEGTYEQKDTQNLYPHFIRLMPALSHVEHGAGGMVVPLSVAYSTNQEFKNLRQFMWNTYGSWQLAHFDRTPDSLFGDDVKTRNTIIFFARMKAGSHELYTSDLLRWSSRSRADLFKEIRFAKVYQARAGEVIPKIGEDFGQEVLRLLDKKSVGTLGQYINRASDPWAAPTKVLRNAVTAYNWLPFERLTSPDSVDTKYHYWTTRNEDEASVAFALVQSRVAYWLWRVWGDGFHLTDQIIKSLPLSLAAFSASALNQLKELGDNLWSEMLENKIMTRNAGVISFSYCPYGNRKLLDQIDELISSAYDLPAKTTQYLKDVVWRTVVAGREDEMASNPALRRWMSGGTK